MNSKIIKFSTLVSLTAFMGIVMVKNNVLADSNENAANAQTENVVNCTIDNTTEARATTYTLYSAALNTQSTQYVNFPQDYNLDTLRSLNTQSSADSFQQIAYPGLSQNNYQSNTQAASENVNINNLTNQQVIEMNQYAVGLVNQTRSEFGLEPYQLSDQSVAEVKNMALQYQNKNESLMNGDWHDPSILANHSENIAAQQIYNDNIIGLTARPFASARGIDFLDNNSVPLFSVTTMDDLRSMIFYGVMGMLFNDASDQYGHAQNFLTNVQKIKTMAVYPSILNGLGTGTYSNGTKFNFNLLNIDMHFIWAGEQSNLPKPDSKNTPGWHLDNGNWQYYNQSGQLQVGWQWVDGAWYYLSPNSGNMLSGVQNIENSIYYLNNSGAMMTGWQHISNNWYYFKNNGAALVGWQYINGHWYYFTNQGIAVTNWQTINKHKYYFDPSNAWAVTGWQQLDNQWYYFDPSNTWMNTDWQWVSNNWYYFDLNYGQMLTGLQSINNQTYYLNVRHDGIYGAMKTGWWNINNNWYFFQNGGSAVTGWYKSGAGNWYYFNNNGQALIGWQKLYNNWYYFDPINAWMIIGWQKINNVWYYFDSSGQMLIGTHIIDGNTYTFAADGHLE